MELDGTGGEATLVGQVQVHMESGGQRRESAADHHGVEDQSSSRVRLVQMSSRVVE